MGQKVLYSADYQLERDTSLPLDPDYQYEHDIPLPLGFNGQFEHDTALLKDSEDLARNDRKSTRTNGKLTRQDTTRRQRARLGSMEGRPRPADLLTSASSSFMRTLQD